MKLVFIVPMYRPSFHSGGKGGGEISNQILLNEFARRGHTVIIISMRGLVRKSVYRDGNLIVIEPFAKLPVNGLGVFLSMLLFQACTSRLLKKINPQIVLCATSTIKVAADAARSVKAPVGAVVRAMENMPGYGWAWSFKSPQSFIKYILHKVTIGWPGGRELDLVDFFIANSKFLEEKYRQAFPDKESMVIYPALAIEEADMPFPDEVRKVMMVGISEEKGFDIFAALSLEFPQIEFNAIGDKSLGDGETRMHKGVYIHGWYKDPIPFIDSMDLVLVPSRVEEAFGRISLEALYRHKYVLVSGRGGLPETVGGGGQLIVRSNKRTEWKAKMAELLGDKMKYREVTLNALESAKEFKLTRQTSSFEAFLNKLQ